RHIDDKEVVGHARKHLRPGERAVHGMTHEFHQPTAAADWMPATIEAAPNRMKTPMMTVAPKRQFMRPVSMPKPTAATAMTATAVATLPSSVPCSQPSAATIGPEPAGSAPWACTETGSNSAASAAKRDSRRIYSGLRK